MNHESRQYKSHNKSSPPSPPSPPPDVGSILRGNVARIESYGAFITLLSDDDNNDSSGSHYQYRGLLHISQLSSYKVDSVHDCLNLNDVIYVKVLQCDEIVNNEETQHRDNIPAHAQRHSSFKKYKISLSFKYASQDGTFQDLDPNNEQYEKETRNRKSFSGNNNDMSRRGNANAQPSQLQTSLNSQIGMGMAIDPLATMQQVSSGHSNIVLRQNMDRSGSNKVVINGYALVDDQEGEIPLPPPPPSSSQPQYRHGNHATVTTDIRTPSSFNSRPMGRGRGATLPSWMTTNQDNEQPLGSGSNQPAATTDTLTKRENNDNIYNSDDSVFSASSASSKLSRHDDRKRRKKHRKHDSKKCSSSRKRRKYDNDSNDSLSSASSQLSNPNDGRKRKKHDFKKSSKKRHKYDHDKDRKSRRRHHHHDRKKKSDSKKSHRRRHHDDSRRSSKRDTYSDSDSSRKDDDCQDSEKNSKDVFQNVEEAKAMIKKLEKGC